MQALIRSFFSIVLPFLFSFWAVDAYALSGTLTGADLIRLLNDYRSSGNQQKQSLAAELQKKLAESGVSFNDYGFSISGAVDPDDQDRELAHCDNLLGLQLGSWFLSQGQFIAPAVGPLTGRVGGGAWSAFLDGNAATLGFSVSRGNIGIGVSLGGGFAANVSGTLHWWAGYPEPHIECNLFGCFPVPEWKCKKLGNEALSVSAKGSFAARVALSLDVSLEQNSTGRYQIVIGRQALASPAGPLTAAVDPQVNIQINTNFMPNAPLWYLLNGRMESKAEDNAKAAVGQKIAASNAQIRTRLPVVYELPNVDPAVRKLVAEIVGSPALHRFVEQHFAEIVFYILVNDRDALAQLVTSAAACEATRLIRASMPAPSLYSNATGACVAADPDGPELARYFSDSACARELAFRPTPYTDFCREILAPAPNTVLGNAAAWTPDANQPNDPLPSAPSRKWTLAQGARLDLGAEPLAGKTTPMMKRVRYRELATTFTIPDLTPLYWGCLVWSFSADADTCRTWGTRTGSAPSDFTLVGYVKTSADAGTTPLYWACAGWNEDNVCTRPVPRTGFSVPDDVLVGYIKTAQEPGTVPIFWNCVQENSDGYCIRSALGTAPGSGAPLGYVYAGTIGSKPACALEMRIYKKDPAATGLTPMLAFHGGTWQLRGGAFTGLEATIAHYTEQGFVVFAPFYRLANGVDGNPECNQAPWQAIASDVEAALDWVKANGAAFGAKSAKPAVMGQSAGAHLAGWLVTHRPAEVAAGLLLYAPSDVRDFLTQARPGGLYEAFMPSLDLLSALFGADVATIDLGNPPEFVRQNSFHDLVRVASGSMPPVFLVHGRADTLVPSNQSVLLCNAYGGSAVNNGGGAARRATYTCGMWGSRLHLFEQGQHVLDACLTTDFLELCFSGDNDSRLLVADSMRQARAFLASNVNQAPSANPGPDKTAVRDTAVTLGGAGTDADGSIASFSWAQIAGPGVALANANTATATFTAPHVGAATLLTFRLTVTDNKGASGSATVNVTVTVPAPVAIANLTPAYWGCTQSIYFSDYDRCVAWGARAYDPGGFAFLGYLKTAPESGTAPLYSGCTMWRYFNDNDHCVGWGVVTGYDPGGFTFVGYIKTSQEAGTTPLYYGCVGTNGEGDCNSYALSTSPVGGVVGYIYYTTTLQPN